MTVLDDGGYSEYPRDSFGAAASIGADHSTAEHGGPASAMGVSPRVFRTAVMLLFLALILLWLLGGVAFRTARR